MITVVNENLMEAFNNPKVDAVIHQVNCQGVMGSGVAGDIRKAYPQHYTDYIETCADDQISRLLGWDMCTETDDKPIHAIFSQEYYGNDGALYSSYWALHMGILEVISSMMYWSYRTIALPYGIGCGLGGGDWDKVMFLLEMLDEAHLDLDIILYKI